jgi:hypothetical protein
MRTNPDRRRWTSWDAVIAVVVALGVAVLVAAPNALSGVEHCHHQKTREVLTAVLRPADSLARGLGLDSALSQAEQMTGQKKLTTSKDDKDGLEAQARTRERAAAQARPKPSAPPRPRAASVIDRYLHAAVPTRPRSRPWRILVTGDSTANEPGYSLANLLPRRVATVKVADFTGSGLLRPDAFDWSLKARDQAASFHPDITLFFMGPNDFYPIDGVSQVSPKWADKYSFRMQTVMEVYAQGGKGTVIYAPPAIDATADASMPKDGNTTIRLMHAAAKKAAARIGGAGHLDMYGLFAVNGKYSDRVRDPGTGRWVNDARFTDGTHLSMAGGRIVARLIARWLGLA